MPARFRRERLLIVGCGDVGLRAARLLGGRVRLLALTSSADRVAVLVRGKLLAEGTPQQIRDDERVQQAYLGTGLVLEKNT